MKLVLDLSYLNEISDGDTNFIISILTTFLEEMPQDISNLKNAVSQKDILLIGKLAHKIKSSLQMLGLLELKQLALEIEITAKKNTAAAIPNVTILIKKLIESLVIVQLKITELNKK